MINEILNYIQNNVLEFTARPLGVPNLLIGILIAIILMEPLYYLLIRHKVFAKSKDGKKMSKISEMFWAKLTAGMFGFFIPFIIVLFIAGILSIILNWKEITLFVGALVFIALALMLWWKANSHIYDGLRRKKNART
jgi:hypothetical protein